MAAVVHVAASTKQVLVRVEHLWAIAQGRVSKGRQGGGDGIGSDGPLADWSW